MLGGLRISVPPNQSYRRIRGLREELPGLQITVLSKSVRLLKFERELIMKNKSIAEELEASQRTVSDEKVARDDVEEEWA